MNYCQINKSQHTGPPNWKLIQIQNHKKTCGQPDRWTDIQTDGCRYVRTHAHTYVRMYGRTNGQMNGRMDGCMDGQTNGRMYRHIILTLRGLEPMACSCMRCAQLRATHIIPNKRCGQKYGETELGGIFPFSLTLPNLWGNTKGNTPLEFTLALTLAYAFYEFQG